MAIPAIFPVNNIPSSAVSEIPEAKVHMALEEEVKKNIEASVHQQIIKKTLFKNESISDEDHFISNKDSHDNVLSNNKSHWDEISISEQAANLSHNESSITGNVSIETLEQASLSFSMQVLLLSIQDILITIRPLINMIASLKQDNLNIKMVSRVLQGICCWDIKPLLVEDCYHKR